MAEGGPYRCSLSLSLSLKLLCVVFSKQWATRERQNIVSRPTAVRVGCALGSALSSHVSCNGRHGVLSAQHRERPRTSSS